LKAYINKNGIRKEVKEIYESYNGDLYFVVSEQEEYGFVLLFARLYSMPDCAEYEMNNIELLKEQYGPNKLWIVVKANWSNINSYEKNLLEVIE